MLILDLQSEVEVSRRRHHKLKGFVSAKEMLKFKKLKKCEIRAYFS